jgi:hypothetical protein
VLCDALAELGEVGIDLAAPLGGDDHEGVLGVDVREQRLDLWLDHESVLLSILRLCAQGYVE